MGVRSPTMSLPRALVLVLVAILLAGCNAPGNGEDEEEDGSTDSSSGIDSTSHSFLINVGGPGMGPVPSSFSMDEFDVEENASGLLLEARWSCASPTCTLDLLLVDPDGAELVRAPGTGTVSFFFPNATAGAYRYGVEAATEPVVQADGDVAITAFYGDASAEGYSAFNSAADRREASGPSPS